MIDLLAGLPPALIWVMAVVIGLSFGSFLTCAVYRVPRGISLWQRSRSFCPACGKDLRWFELVPVFSWVIQHGRCRRCKAWIGWRYVLIELACLVFILLLVSLTLF